MTRLVLLIVFLLAASIGLHTPAAHAEPMLQMQPLQYRSELKSGERQKGFVDITNPTAEPVTVKLGVQAFKQTDSKGTLSFYDDERLRAGILLDYQEASIPAHKTLRLYFIVDGAKLPAGDVFAAIFAKTVATNASGVDMSVRLGTLLILTNGSPSEHQATISKMTVPRMQLRQGIAGEVAITNTASRETSSGFFPEITLHAWPFGRTVTLKAPLVYAGNTRTVPFELTGDYFGVYKIVASHGASQRSVWVVAVTGIWRWLSIVLLVLAVGGVVGLLQWRRRRRT